MGLGSYLFNLVTPLRSYLPLDPFPLLEAALALPASLFYCCSCFLHLDLHYVHLT
jgi:hypothetical protein